MRWQISLHDVGLQLAWWLSVCIDYILLEQILKIWRSHRRLQQQGDV